MQYTSPDKFAAIWNAAESLKKAAKKAETTPILATARASRLRRAGMKMKMFKRGRVAKASK
jgi:hypothetical protein